MTRRTFRTDADVPAPARLHRRGCRCALHARRLFAGGLCAGTAAVALPGWAQALREDVGKESRFTKLVPAEDVEQAATQQYAQLLQQASRKKALGPANHPQVVRLRAIADRIKPFAPPWNERASRWKWEVNLIGSKELNAFCMPGGKIAFFYGILQQLQLSDDEVAAIMGHEMAHALREHARERMGKSAATNIGASVLSSLLGLGGLGDSVLGMGSQLLTLKFSRDDESEADIVGMELAARAGYNPHAGVTLWEKMIDANKGAPPEFMSTHPSGPSRIKDIESKLPKVEPLYAQADKPPRRFEPPAPARRAE
jgi:predicted Zn-dependent protease